MQESLARLSRIRCSDSKVDEVLPTDVELRRIGDPSGYFWNIITVLANLSGTRAMDGVSARSTSFTKCRTGWRSGLSVCRWAGRSGGQPVRCRCNGDFHRSNGTLRRKKARRSRSIPWLGPSFMGTELVFGGQRVLVSIEDLVLDCIGALREKAASNVSTGVKQHRCPIDVDTKSKKEKRSSSCGDCRTARGTLTPWAHCKSQQTQASTKIRKNCTHVQGTRE